MKSGELGENVTTGIDLLGLLTDTRLHLGTSAVIEVKVIAQKLLSCAYRTGQRFGAMHLIDVLVGRLTDRVKQFGHDRISVFGIGAELNEKQWRAAIRQLVAMGHIQPDSEALAR